MPAPVDTTIRNVTIRGMRTSMRLENEYWDALDEASEKLGTTWGELLNRICTAAQQHHPDLSYSRAVRVWAVRWFRDQVADAERRARRRAAAQ